MKTRILAGVALCLTASAGTYSASAQPAQSNQDATLAASAADNLTRLCFVSDVMTNTDRFEPLLRVQKQPSMRDVAQVALQFKLPFRAARLNWQQLQQRGSAALLHLKAPEQFLTVASFGAKYSVVYNEGRADIMANDALMRRYAGEALTVAAQTMPMVQVNDPVQMARVTSLGEPLSIQVPVVNRGKAKLELSVEQTSCSCTGDDQSTKLLAPQQTGALKFKVQPDAQGTRLITATVRASDPTRPRILLAFQVTTPQSATQAPAPVFLSGAKGQVINQEMTLTLPIEAKVLRVSTTHPWLVATQAGEMQGTSRRFALAVAPTAPAGAFEDQVVIELKGGDVTRVVVPVQGFIDADIVLNPRMMNLGSVAPGTIIKRKITVQNPMGQPFALKSIVSSSPRVVAKLDSTAMAAQHEIEVQITSNADSGATLQERVTLTLADNRTLDLDIFGTIALAGQTTPATPTP